LALLLCNNGCVSVKQASSPPDEKYSEQDALRMIRASRGTLAPVYAPLAEQITTDFNLYDKEGIGIDLGSGPGTLIIELCKRTRLNWISENETQIDTLYGTHNTLLSNITHGEAGETIIMGSVRDITIPTAPVT
jgi:hypothetical protein